MTRTRGNKHDAGLALCLLGLVLLVGGGCNQSTSSPPWNITGGWYVYHDVNGVSGEQGPDIFTFTTVQSSLSGTTPAARNLTGSVNELAVNFHWTEADGTILTYDGQIANDGKTISGTWSTSAGQGGTWHALVEAGTQSAVGGTWNVVTTTNGIAGEQGPATFVLKHDLNTLTGTSGDGSAITGNTSLMKILFTWVRRDGAAIVSIGDVAIGNATMSGTWSGSGGQSGTWRATK